MKKTFNLFALIVAFALVFVLVGCGKKTETPTTKTPVATTTKAPVVTTTQAPGTTTENVTTTAPDKAPVITVNPKTVEINAGEEVELLFGVTATDEVDGTVNVIVFDDDDFDNEAPGTYTITYKAVNSKGVEATETRTIVVGEPLSDLALEVRENKLGEAKWEGCFINFKHALFVEVTANTEYTKQSGVFYNSTDSNVTISVEGTYGCSAILDKNGVVLEGRDGANSKLVNAANPTRAGSTVTKFDEETTVSSAFAMNMVIPAKGYAVVIQANYAGTTADSDGRSFMNYNVIYQYGNVVRLLWVDDSEVLTPYVNQGPTVSGNTKIVVPLNSTANAEDLVKAGLTIKDDNGTFQVSDDTTITEVTVKSNGGYNAAAEAEYTFTLEVSDGTLTTEFTRVVSVLGEDKCTTIQIGNNKHIVLNDALAKDLDLTSVGNYSYILYTPAYTLPTGETELGYTNGYGEAFVINEYGEIVACFDGANAKYYDADNTGGVQDATKCTAAGYLKEAFAYAQTNHMYVLIAPNSTANNAAGGSRPFLLGNRTVGAKVKITGVNFKDKVVTFTVNDKSFEAKEEDIAIDTAVALGDVAKKKMLIFTPDFAGDSINCNGYGVALVLNKFGVLVRIYDGANAKLFDAENPSGKTGAGFTGADYGTYAFSQLLDDQYLIIFPNDGTNGADSPRTFASGLRMDGSIGKAASITGITFQEDALLFQVNGKSFKAGAGLYVIDEAVALADVAKKKMLLFTPAFTGESINCNGYGVALVLNKYGELIIVYDGANGNVYDADHTSGYKPEGFAAGSYGTYAFEHLGADEYLLIFPNDGTNGADSARTFALTLRTDGSIGKTVSLTDIEFQVKVVPTFKIGNNTFTKEGEITVAYNDATATHATHDFLVFTSDFRGTSALANGYGEAFVIKDGKIVRIYDGANGRYRDADNPTGVVDNTKCTADDYFKFALASLQSGEWLIVAPNDGGSNLARKFLLDNRTVGADVTFNLVTVTTSTKSESALGIAGKMFFGASVLVNGYGKVADYDFAIYSYGYTGRVIKNGWCEAFVIDMSNGKVVRIYDGVSPKYFDADNQSGVAPGTYFSAATASFDAFESLKPGEIVVFGFNGGPNGNAGRAFLAANRTYNAQASVMNFTLPTPATEAQTIKAIVVDGDKYYVSSALPTDAGVTSAAVPFLVYTKAYTGSAVANGYGVAIVVNSEGKTVRVYDGTSGKMWDSTHTDGSGSCTPGSYLAEALASLQEGEYLLCAPNDGGSNVARGFLVDHRALGKDVVIPTFE